jgi:O-succinylbenzoic acid--CoA ligase
MVEALPSCSEPWLAARARRDPAGLAIVSGATALDWRTLAARADAVAARLRALGVRPGDRVGLLMEPSIRLVELVHAAQGSGAALVILNTRLTAPEIAVLVAHAEPVLVLHDAAHAGLLAGSSAPILEAHAALEAIPAAPSSAPVDVDPAAIATILYTSGTTGRPKGVVLTHGNHDASACASRERLGLRPADRWLSVLPLHHVGGLSIVMRSVLDGTPLVLHPRFDAAAVRHALAHEAITLLSLVPTMLHRLLEESGGDVAPTSLRCVLVGGAALAPELAARARGRGWPIAPTYGLTEAASQVATATPAGSSETGVGAPLPGTRVRIGGADAEGRGEIQVSGPTIMRGYFRDDEATRAALRDGRLHTGDVGRLDADGRLEVFDRRSDVVITGGENVYPTEVESVLLAHPAVAEAAVYGVADAEWGKRVQAAVVVRAGAAFDADAVRAWCRTRLAGYKIPRAIVAVAELPRTASGKIRRHALVSAS